MGDRIDWSCDVCGGLVQDDQGYLILDEGALKQAERDMAAWESKHPEGDFASRVLSVKQLLAQPDPVQWRVLHQGCDPDPEADDYTIGVEMIRTPRHALGWTFHLFGMRWFRYTDWSEFIRARVGAPMDRSAV